MEPESKNNELQLKMKTQPKNWNEKKMRAAVEGVKSKTLTLGKASKIFGIPKSTLSDKINNKHPIEKKIKTILTPEDERKLALWLISLVRNGCKHPKQQLLQQVQKILNNEGRETVFTNNLPGNKWYYGFLRRQGIVSLRQAQEIENQPGLETTPCEELKKHPETLGFTVSPVQAEPSSEFGSSKERLKAAVEAVRTKAFTLGKASKNFGIPKSTLCDKVHERYPLEKIPKTILTPEEELQLGQWLTSITKKGYKLPKQQLLLQVQKILNNQGKKTVFPNNLPDNKWYYAFLKRQGMLHLNKKNYFMNLLESEEKCFKLQATYSVQKKDLDGLLDIVQLISPDKLSDYRNRLINGGQCDDPEFIRFSSLYKKLCGHPESKYKQFVSSSSEEEEKSQMGQLSEILQEKEWEEFSNENLQETMKF